MNSPNKCPVCGSKRCVAIKATGGEWVELIYTAYGMARLNACADCGNVYISETDRKMLQKCLKEKEKSK